MNKPEAICWECGSDAKVIGFWRKLIIIGRIQSLAISVVVKCRTCKVYSFRRLEGE